MGRKNLFLFLLIMSLAFMSMAKREEFSIYKGKKVEELTGYPVSFGNVPFNYYGIRETGRKPKCYYIPVDNQKEIMKLEYGLYTFYGYLWKGWEPDVFTNLQPGAYRLDGVFIPVKWKKK
jgi:hypothetical protein